MYYFCLGWIFLAVKHAVVIGVCIVMMNVLCYRNACGKIVSKVVKKKD
jgi:hypothetical protein